MKEKTKFRNLQEFMRTFSDEKVCREYLERKCWNGHPICPECGYNEAYKLGDGKTYKCKDCYRKFTVTVGTIFENSNIPLSKWFTAIYICTAHKKGISSLQLHRDLGVTQKTAWFMLHRIREMLRGRNPKLLTKVVEADETYVGGKGIKGSKRGRGAEHKTVVLGLAERQDEIRTQPVEDVKAKTLLPIIRKNIEPIKTIVMTDELPSYNKVNWFAEHKVINHGQGKYANGDIHTNTIEGFWSLLKRGINGIYHSVSSKHLHRYCDEFSYRYNTRKIKDVERFDVSLEQVNGRLTYKNLVKN